MRKRLFWIVGSAILVLLITVSVLIFANPFGINDKNTTFIVNHLHKLESQDILSYKWNDNLGACDPLMPINYSDPQIVNDTSEFYKNNSNSEFDTAWSKDDYKVGKKITDRPEDIARLVSSIKTRHVFYVKPEDKNVEAKIGDLVVLSTMNNKIDIQRDYEIVDDGINNYKMKILIAVNDGKQNLEFTSITDDGKKIASSVIVDVK